MYTAKAQMGSVGFALQHSIGMSSYFTIFRSWLSWALTYHYLQRWSSFKESSPRATRSWLPWTSTYHFHAQDFHRSLSWCRYNLKASKPSWDAGHNGDFCKGDGEGWFDWGAGGWYHGRPSGLKAFLSLYWHGFAMVWLRWTLLPPWQQGDDIETEADKEADKIVAEIMADVLAPAGVAPTGKPKVPYWPLVERCYVNAWLLSCCMY